MLSGKEIEAHVESITSRLAIIAQEETGLAGCMEIAEKFGVLREEYRRQPEAFAGQRERLAQLRKRFDEVLASRLDAVIDRFHEVAEAVRRAESEKAFWRDFLIRRSAQLRQEQLNGANAVVRVRTKESRLLPAVQSPERDRLEVLIRQSGQWDQVSQLARARLEKAMNDGLFSKGDTDAIGQLCPLTVVHQVTSRSLSGGGTAGW